MLAGFEHCGFTQELLALRGKFAQKAGCTSEAYLPALLTKQGAIKIFESNLGSDPFLPTSVTMLMQNKGPTMATGPVGTKFFRKVHKHVDTYIRTYGHMHTR